MAPAVGMAARAWLRRAHAAMPAGAIVPAGAIIPAGPDFEAAGPDLEAAGPDFEAAGPDFEAAGTDFEAVVPEHCVSDKVLLNFFRQQWEPQTAPGDLGP